MLYTKCYRIFGLLPPVVQHYTPMRTWTPRFIIPKVANSLDLQAHDLPGLGVSPPLGASQHTKGPHPTSLDPGTLYRPGSPGNSTSLVLLATTLSMGTLRVFGLTVEAKGPHQGTTPHRVVVMVFPTSKR